MQDLSEHFERQLANPRNDVMLANMGSIVQSHIDRPIGNWKYYEDETADNLLVSATPQEGSIVIDRSITTILSPFGVRLSQLQAFATGGAVLDTGYGMSPFLDGFSEHANTIAVDANEGHAAYQAEKGHKSIVASGKDMDTIDDNSVRLLNASYSLPFWPLNPTEAREALREFARVLEVGGIALIGGVTRSDIHIDWEYTLEALRYGNRVTGPWLDGDYAFLSHTFSAFLGEMLSSNRQGNLNYGYLDIVGRRDVTRRSSDYRSKAPQVQVPNFVMFRKVA